MPAASTASTWKLCAPSARPEYVFGLVQAAKPPPSSRQRKLTPGSPSEKLKEASVEPLGSGGAESIEGVGGATVSTVQLRVAGVGSALPAASRARTRNVCAPSARPEYVFGLVQAAKPPPSSSHSKPAPASLEKVKIASAEPTVPTGPESIVVSGAVVSIVHP